MSGDPKRSSFRARQRNYVGPNRKMGDVLLNVDMADAEARFAAAKPEEFVPSNTPKPSPSSEG